MLEQTHNLTLESLLTAYPIPVAVIAALLLVLVLLFVLRGQKRHRRRRRMQSVEAELDEVDRMEGHEFEYWCAELLEDSGFEKVMVTPGSGDQGVDITAERDEVRFAFQCKCYQSRRCRRFTPEKPSTAAMSAWS